MALAFQPLQAASMKSYTHGTEGFTLKYPSEWEAREDVTYELFKIPFLAIRPLAGENDTYRENVNVVTEKVAPKMSLEVYLKANLKEMPKGLQSFKKIGTGTLSGGKTPSEYLIYSHKSQGIKMKAVVFFYRKGPKGYSVTCTSTPEGFDGYWDLFQAMGKSFKP